MPFSCRMVYVAALLAPFWVVAGEEPAGPESGLDSKLAERHRRTVALGEVLEASGQWERAAEQYEMARRIRDDDIHVLTQLASLYRARAEDAKTLSVYAALCRLQPASVAWLREVGSCHFRLGQREQAEAVWGKILEVQPSRAFALRYLAEIYASHGLHEKAVGACRDALALSPNDEDIRQRLGEALLAAGDPLAALAASSRLAADRSSARAERARRLRQGAFQALDLPAAVRGAVEARLAEGPCGAADLAWAAARCLEEKGETKRAASFYRRLAKEEPDTPRGKEAAEKARRPDPG
jgi:tetratricopeptide (TPR) repeat protein